MHLRLEIPIAQLLDFAKAIQAYQRALEAAPAGAETWRIEEVIANLFVELGDRSNALIHAQSALNEAPDAQKGPVAAIDQPIKQSRLDDCRYCILLCPYFQLDPRPRVVRWVSTRRGIVAQPRADRWHQMPTPLLGGVGIFFAFIASLAALFFWNRQTGLA